MRGFLLFYVAPGDGTRRTQKTDQIKVSISLYLLSHFQRVDLPLSIRGSFLSVQMVNQQKHNHLLVKKVLRSIFPALLLF